MSASTTTHERTIPSPEAATMKACVLIDVARLEVRDVPRPQVSSRDVLVRVAAVGICGTDTHIFAGHANYNTDERGVPIPLTVEPQILGHESLNTTSRYTKRSQDDLATAADKMSY